MTDYYQFAALIEQAFEKQAEISPESASTELKYAVEHVIGGLNAGELRVATKSDAGWQVNQWVKKAVLLSFKLMDNHVFKDNVSHYFDKVPLKFRGYTREQFQQQQARVVPPAMVRHGVHLGRGCVLMPSYINIGAYIDEQTMIDTWATVGSCAQIGKRVHISGGAGIGGVLEPLQANPTIIEDDCFIGARSEIVEGVIVEQGSVISMGVFIGQSTKIYHRDSGEVSYGRIPAGSVVVPGSLPSKDGSYSLACAVVVKQVDSQTRAKTSINDLLRGV